MPTTIARPKSFGEKLLDLDDVALIGRALAITRTFGNDDLDSLLNEMLERFAPEAYWKAMRQYVRDAEGPTAEAELKVIRKYMAKDAASRCKARSL